MKGEKSALWEKAPNALGKGPTDMNANEILGKSTTMPVGSGKDPSGKGLEERPPKTIGHDAAEPTLKGMRNTESKSPKSMSAKAGAYAGEMGTGKEKLSPMAQKVGKPRKGY